MKITKKLVGLFLLSSSCAQAMKQQHYDWLQMQLIASIKQNNTLQAWKYTYTGANIYLLDKLSKRPLDYATGNPIMEKTLLDATAAKLAADKASC